MVSLRAPGIQAEQQAYLGFFDSGGALSLLGTLHVLETLVAPGLLTTLPLPAGMGLLVERPLAHTEPWAARAG